MKNSITVFVLFFLAIGCKGQLQLVDVSDNQEMNYTISSINKTLVLNKSLFGGSIYVNVFEMSDPRAAPVKENGTDEIQSSFLISMVPDGDYYTSSKLVKIQNLVFPELIELKENEYPNFHVLLEHGEYGNRKREQIQLQWKDKGE